MPTSVYTRTHAPIDVQFWSRVDRNGPTHPTLPDPGVCWEWTGPLECGGYGAFRSRKYGRYQAHRLAWKMATGDSTAIAIFHSCDNRRCVRNDSEGCYTVNGIALPRRGHLFRGDRTINAHDKIAKGRGRYGVVRGSRVGTSKVTESDIPAIIEMVDSGIPRKVIGAQFGITDTMVGYIYNRKCWQHVKV